MPNISIPAVQRNEDLDRKVDNEVQQTLLGMTDAEKEIFNTFTSSAVLSRKAVRLIVVECNKQKDKLHADALACINSILAPGSSLAQKYTDSVGKISHMLSSVNSIMQRLATILSNWDGELDADVHIDCTEQMLAWNNEVNAFLQKYIEFRRQTQLLTSKIQLINDEMEKDNAN